jgi:THO complex subunit 1
VKDFVKKIKIEDNRIEMRKKTLARQAERIATARAKAVAAVTGTSMTQETTIEQAKPSAPATATGSPLHPSLPAKPGSASPSKTSESAQAQPTPTATTPTPVPTPIERVPTPVPPATPPITTPPDEQILKLEEVTVSNITPST